MFNNPLPRVSHPDCIFRGDPVCRYLVTWETQRSRVWKTARNISLFILMSASIAFGLKDFRLAISTVIPLSAVTFFLLTAISAHTEKKEFKSVLTNLQGTSNELLEQIEANYNNSRLTNEIGENISSQTTIEGVLTEVIKLFKKRLNYDRGLIMLPAASTWGLCGHSRRFPRKHGSTTTSLAPTPIHSPVFCSILRRL